MTTPKRKRGMVTRTMVRVPADIIAFLHGTEPLEGIWFGSLHHKREGRYWWRSIMRERCMYPIHAPAVKVRKG